MKRKAVTRRRCLSKCGSKYRRITPEAPGGVRRRTRNDSAVWRRQGNPCRRSWPPCRSAARPTSVTSESIKNKFDTFAHHDMPTCRHDQDGLGQGLRPSIHLYPLTSGGYRNIITDIDECEIPEVIAIRLYFRSREGGEAPPSNPPLSQPIS